MKWLLSPVKSSARQARNGFISGTESRTLAATRARLQQPCLFDNQLALHLSNPQIALSLNAFDAILSCVAHHLGITFISKRMLHSSFYTGHFVQLHTEQRFMRKFTLCYHKSKFISPTLASWLSFSRSWPHS